MASVKRRLPANVAGEFFVDATCIDCDTCRWMAPDTFDRQDAKARVHRQPGTAAERQRALEALISCPTGSIGTVAKADPEAARRAFPKLVAEDVHHCGYHAEASFGAASWFVRRPAERGGNVLVDSPRFSAPLVRRLEELGGVSLMFLTHQDDVADHERFARRFHCRRVIHEADAPPGVEVLVRGRDPFPLDPELLVIPVPGHTRGSACLLYRNRFLFTGDHLAWSASRGHLYAFPDACWYDWEELKASMERLAAHDFEWVLPGHGRSCRFPREEMRVQMRRCLEWLRGR